MKKLFCLLFIAMVALNAGAQVMEKTKVEGDSVKHKVKPLENNSQDRLIMEITWDNWMNQPDTVDLHEQSRGFNFYFMYDHPLGKSLFSIAPGLGIGTNNFFLKDQEIRVDSMVHFTESSRDVKKYKLMVGYVDVPLELRFRTKPNKFNQSFKIAVGAKAGMRIANHTKAKIDPENRDSYKEKESDIQYLNKYRYGATFRIGYSYFNLIGYYGLSDLLEENRGPKINVFSLGISFNGL